MKIEVIIPTYRPGTEFERTLERLSRQTLRPWRLTVWNTEKTFWNPVWEKQYPGMVVHHISREAFDHGGTRRRAAMEAQGDVLVFMTQDAVPAEARLLEELTRKLTGETAVAYARQLPPRDAPYLERLTREFNYPGASQLRSEADKARLGIKAYFCSDVCAAYRRDLMLKVGGFEERTLFNEDMILCGRLLQAGYCVYYAAEARVVHGHRYSWRMQLRRNFDLGVSQAQHPEIFSGVSSEKEGLRLVRTTCGRLLREHRAYLIPDFFMTTAFKYAGFFLGKRYEKLPRSLLLCLTLNRSWWKEGRG